MLFPVQIINVPFPVQIVNVLFPVQKISVQPTVLIGPHCIYGNACDHQRNIYDNKSFLVHLIIWSCVASASWFSPSVELGLIRLLLESAGGQYTSSIN